MKFPRSLFAGPASLLLFAATVSSAATMDELWPNADHLGWRYFQHHETYTSQPIAVDNQILIFFDGTVTAAPAIEAQYLRQVLVSGPARAADLDETLPEDAFLRQLWIARPDLREKIRRSLDAAPCPRYAPPGDYALFLGGEFAFRKTAEEVATWRCELPNTRSWKWLVSDLTIGTTFTLQLVPDWSIDVFLRGTIAAIEPSNVPAGAFASCVRVDYVVDYGVTTCTDAAGNPLGEYRSETRGLVRFAPGVGPVESREEFIPYAAATGSCVASDEIGRAASLTTLRLGETTVPARTTSWGRLKLAYR